MNQESTTAIHTSSGLGQWLWLLLPVLVAVVYAGALQAGFYLDDETVILLNGQVTHLAAALKGALLADRGLVTLSFAINYALGGTEPWGYHLVNVIIHAVNVLLLDGVLHRVLRLPRVACSAKRARNLALAGAAMWAIHPLASQAVIYVAQRAELMASGMLLLCTYALVRSSDDTSKHPRRWQVLTVIACVLGMQCKLIMFTAPLVMLAMDRLLIAECWSELWRQRRWMYVGLFATWMLPMITGMFAYLFTDTSDASAGAGLAGIISPVIYLTAQSSVILYYLKLSFWPAVLIFDHTWPIPTQVSEGAVTLVITSSLFVLTMVLVLRGVRWSLLPLAFFLILAPTSSFVPVMDLCVEHRMYLPLACVCVGVVLLLDRLLRSHGKVLGGLLIVLVLLLSLRTVIRVMDYHDATSLWQSVLRYEPNSVRAGRHLQLAKVLRQGLGDQIHELQRMIASHPDDADALHQLGAIKLQLQLINQARGPLEKACELQPDNATYRMSLARLQRVDGHRELAKANYQWVLKQQPDNLAALTALAEIQASDKQWDTALALLRHASALKPDDASLLINRANVLLRADRPAEALVIAQRADAIKRTAQTVSILASAYAANGKWSDARDLFEQLFKANPNNPATMQRLAWLYATCPDATVRDATRALQLARAFFDRIGTASPTSWDTLAAALARNGQFDEAVNAQHHAIDRLNAVGRPDLVPSYQQRMDLYQQHHAYVQPASSL